MVNFKDLFPKTHVDSLAMAFTLVMIPVSYLHGVIFIAPIIWPTTNVPEALAEQNTFPYYASLTLMTFLFVNTMVNLFLTMTVDTSCRRVALPVVSQPGWYFCPFCQHYSPPRAHHCPTCKKCVLKRDHHCYFAGKCVGYYNQRYFVAFLIYLTISSVYGAILSLWAITILLGQFSLTYIPAVLFPVIAFLFQITPVNPWIMMETSIAMFVTVGAGGLLLMQLYTIYNGKTYYEYQKGDGAYNRGPRNNFIDSLGTRWLICWVFPFIPSPQPGDGTHYQPRDKAAAVAARYEKTRNSTNSDQSRSRKLVKST